MPSIRDLYTYYLTAEQLLGKSHVVHIAACTVEELWNRQTKRKEHKLVLRFHGKKLALVCNKTQAATLEQITGSDDFSKWVGHSITLSPGKAPTGANTIVIGKAPAPTPTTHVNGNAGANNGATPTAQPDADNNAPPATPTPAAQPDAGAGQVEASDHAPTKHVRPARARPAA